MGRIPVPGSWIGYLVGGLLWSGSLSFAQAAEFYSWIDASGTMVITDDPGQIPSEGSRSSVLLHRFSEGGQVEGRDTRGSVEEPAMPPRGPVSDERGPGEEPPSREERRHAQDEQAEGDLPPVVVDVPEDRVKDWYRWIPLTTPLYLATGAISGFWCHRHVRSPEEALQRFLRGQRAGRLPWGATVPSGSGLSGASTGQAIYDQVVRERQALMERNFLQFPSQGPPSRSSTHGLPGAGRGGRASAR